MTQEHFDIQEWEDVTFFILGHSSGLAARISARAVDDRGDDVHIRFNFLPPEARGGSAARFEVLGVDTLNVPLHITSLDSVLELLRSEDPVRIVRGESDLNDTPRDMVIARRPSRSPRDRFLDESVQDQVVDPGVASSQDTSTGRPS